MDVLAEGEVSLDLVTSGSDRPRAVERAPLPPVPCGGRSRRTLTTVRIEVGAPRTEGLEHLGVGGVVDVETVASDGGQDAEGIGEHAAVEAEVLGGGERFELVAVVAVEEAGDVEEVAWFGP